MYYSIRFAHASTLDEQMGTFDSAFVKLKREEQEIEDRGPISSIRYRHGLACGWIFLRMLSADFRAHEKNVGDAEANGHQAEQGCNVRPDKIEALAQLQRVWQDSFGLAL